MRVRRAEVEYVDGAGRERMLAISASEFRRLEARRRLEEGTRHVRATVADVNRRLAEVKTGLEAFREERDLAEAELDRQREQQLAEVFPFLEPPRPAA